MGPEITTEEYERIQDYRMDNTGRDLPEGAIRISGSTDEISGFIDEAVEENSGYDLSSLYSIRATDSASETVELSYHQFKALYDLNMVNMSSDHDGVGGGIAAFVNIELEVAGTAQELQAIFDNYQADF